MVVNLRLLWNVSLSTGGEFPWVYEDSRSQSQPWNGNLNLRLKEMVFRKIWALLGMLNDWCLLMQKVISVQQWSKILVSLSLPNINSFPSGCDPVVKWCGLQPKSNRSVYSIPALVSFGSILSQYRKRILSPNNDPWSKEIGA